MIPLILNQAALSCACSFAAALSTRSAESAPAKFADAKGAVAGNLWGQRWPE